MNNTSSIQNDLHTTSRKMDSYFNSILNLLFSPHPKAGNIRYLFFQILFVFTWILCAFTFNNPGDLDYAWLDFLHTIPYPIMGTVKSIVELFLAWDVLLVLFSLYMGFFIALKFASIYLADIFDIKELSISEKYLKQSAFSSPVYYQIHIEDAQVRQDDQKSPIFKIGGPGKVIINLENAVVFEKIDGTPRIGGPSIEKEIELESFERIRRIIDLRDQTATIDIFARSMDGIPIEIKDIRIIFSVLRNTSNINISNPYPFREDAIYWLVFHQGPGPWTASLIDLVRTELTEYINNHLLSELLSSVGTPEINTQIQNQVNIYKNIRKNWSHSRRYKINRRLIGIQKEEAPNYKPIYYKKRHHKQIRFSQFFRNKNYSIPEFVPRNAISNLFYENIANSFQSKIQRYGMRLEWINVGTWHSSSSVIPEQHLQAWKISSENASKLNPKVLHGTFRQSRRQYLAKNIQVLPIISFIQK
ncbi:MAG TPA: hypothetical protein VK856_07010, partial [Anaerolineaceae bacterium]|nr:hypothetical protein [Anaerolineaceae bacterium]